MIPTISTVFLRDHQPLCQSYGIDVAQPGQFIPRAIFGKYVSTLMEERTRDLTSGRVLKKIVADVQDMQECPGGLRVWLDETESITARKVVLAPGNFPPGDPPLRDRSFYRSQQYLGTPWASENLTRIRQAREVLVLGMGLTAIDLVLALREEGGATERIHLLSRHGKLLQPHRSAPPYPPFLPVDYRPTCIRELTRRVRAELRRAAEAGIDWRPVLDSLRAVTPALWHTLDLPNKRRFLRHVRPFWEGHRHRVPLDVLTRIEADEAAGSLVRHQGRIRRMVAANDRAQVFYHAPGERQERMVEVDLVVNCTGPESNYRKLNDPLIVNLLARGLIHPDRLFLGLEVAPDGALQSVSGDYSKSFYTLGSPRRGQLYETTAVPELRQQARQLARRLVDDLQPIMAADGVATFEI